MKKQVTLGGSEHESVSVRKIENGYIVSHSCMDPKSGYKSREVFTKDKPMVEIGGAPKVQKRALKGSSLSRAMRSI